MLFALVIIITLFLIVITVALIAKAIDKPKKKKRIEELRQAIVNDWIPQKKVIYVSSDTPSFAATKLFEETILPKYSKYIIYDKWSSSLSDLTSNYDDAPERVQALQNDVMGDYDNEPGLKLAVLNSENSFFDEYYTLWFYEGGKSGQEIELRGEVVSLKMVEEKLISTIEGTLKDWKLNK